MEHRNYVANGSDENYYRENRSAHYSENVRAYSNTISTEMASQIRSMETDAYRAVLMAFNAQSDVLTWDKEGLISSLRKELNVSDIEHREALQKINTDDHIKRIRDFRKRGDTQIEMPLNSTAHVSHKRMKVPLVNISSSPNYPDQPSSVAIHSSSVAQFKGAQISDEVAIVPKSDRQSRRETEASKSVRPVNLQVSDSIEIRATDKLIYEIEKVICGEEVPKMAQVEKAKLILKEQERAILEALEKLSTMSQGDESPTNSLQMYSNEEQQRFGRKGTSDQGFYQQAVRSEGYYD